MTRNACVIVFVIYSFSFEFRPFALSTKGSENRKYTQRLEMLDAFPPQNGMMATVLVALLVLIAVVIAAIIWWWPREKTPVVKKSRCPKLLTRSASGSFRLDTGEEFPTMSAFQQWWQTTHATRCAIPILQGPGPSGGGGGGGDAGEQMWATTPINKLDDYEFSRVFGYEKGGHMIVPRQDFNLILEKRAFDWADLPMTSSEREGKYTGMVEGFAASGELGSTSQREVGSTSQREVGSTSLREVGSTSQRSQREVRPTSLHEARSRFDPEQTTVEELVQNAYKDDPDWTPVLTRIGPNQWEVNTLNPRRSRAEVVNESRNVEAAHIANAVDVRFQYRQNEDRNTALGPHIGTETAEHLPDWRGRMELPFAPTTEHPGDWSIKSPGWT